MKKNLIRMFTGLLILLVLVFGTIAVFLYTAPQIGGTATAQQVESYKDTGHYSDGQFLNEEEINLQLNCHSIVQMVREMFNPHPNVVPQKNIEVQSVEPGQLAGRAETTARITWLGHSSFIVEIDGQVLLLDPVFSDYAAPHPWLGRKRFNNEMPILIEDLPEIDAVLISHDHYDHLDYSTIKNMGANGRKFLVPLGVGNHLRRWGVGDDRIREFDWWEEYDLNGLKIAFTPARHMSGRGLTDQSSTLWGSWVIHGSGGRIYFSGDGGYGKHFKEIGERYGPFDLGLMESGQYNELWADVHMMPEQSVAAALDIQASVIMPIHWGSFTLAPHDWTDPIVRITVEANRLDIPITTPQIGEPYILGSSVYPASTWWRRYSEG